MFIKIILSQTLFIFDIYIIQFRMRTLLLIRLLRRLKTVISIKKPHSSIAKKVNILSQKSVEYLAENFLQNSKVIKQLDIIFVAFEFYF